MRIRSLKPEFWTDEVTGLMEATPALFFAGLWSFADDDGRFRWDPVLLRAQIDPYDAKFGGPKGIESLLLGLLTLQLVTKYEVDGRTYGVIPSFKKHQHPDKAKKSTLPPPPREAIKKAPRNVGDGSGTDRGEVGAGGEGIGGEGSGGAARQVPDSAASKYPQVDAFVAALRGHYQRNHCVTGDILRGSGEAEPEMAREVARFPSPEAAAEKVAAEVKARLDAKVWRRVACDLSQLVTLIRELPATPTARVKVLA